MLTDLFNEVCRTSSYKSRVKRELSSAPQFRIVRLKYGHEFKIPSLCQVKGPGPGLYEAAPLSKTPVTTSVFKSGVARFNTRNNVSAQPHPLALAQPFQPTQKTPGPADYYCKTSVFGKPKPLPAVVTHLKKHSTPVT